MKPGDKPAKSPRCALSRLIPSTMDVEEVKADGYRNHGILVVSTDDARLSWIERQILTQIGAKLYGKGERHGGN